MGGHDSGDALFRWIVDVSRVDDPLGFRELYVRLTVSDEDSPTGGGSCPGARVFPFFDQRCLTALAVRGTAGGSEVGKTQGYREEALPDSSAKSVGFDL